MASPDKVRCRLRIVSDLPSDLGYIPFSPEIDFAALIEQAGAVGRFDPNSVEIVDLADGSAVEFALTSDFAHGDRGRVEWAIRDPAHREYEICFRTAGRRPLLRPRPHVPMVGVGDLLRYNAGEPRPIALSYSMKLVDLTGDGKPDLAGCWNYYYRPGDPISGVVFYPRDSEEGFTFGERVRLRFVEHPDSDRFHHFPGTYVQADFADFTGNGLPDIAFADGADEGVSFFLNQGRRDEGGTPVFVRDLFVPAPVEQLCGIHAVDLDGDGVLDLVVNGHFIRNANPEGWPFQPEEPVDLGLGQRIAFIDLDGDGRLDLVQLGEADRNWTLRGGQPLVWRRRTGDDPISFGPPMPLPDIQEQECSFVSAVEDGPRRGLLVQYEAYQNIVFYELTGFRDGRPRFERRERAQSICAVMAFSDQAWPCLCDWNGDGVQDLLIGGGYGWPRIVINQGSNERPAWREPERIYAEGKPIRLLRNEILHSHHWHDMGYPYPVFVDWDGDGLPDLMLPNETNRIAWYRNIGTREEPRFGPRQFLEVDGFPDSEELRAASGRDAEDPDLPNHPYPRDERSPFFWRTGAAFADWNGDGLMDFITLDYERKAALFVQYRDEQGRLRLRREGPVRLEDGRLIDDSIVGRQKHWTESFRAVDWDGDGLIDLIYNLAGTGEIYLLRNVGSTREPVFAAPRQMKCYGEPLSFTIHGPSAWAGDLNGDGKPDLLGCVEWSVYPFFAHAALEMEAHPEYRIELVDV